MDIRYFILIGTSLILLGFLVLLSGIIISIVSGRSLTESEIKGGGVVFIGPIPLIFGTDKSTVIFVAILAIILMIFYYFILGRASP